MPLGLSAAWRAAALACWHSMQQLCSLPAATQLRNDCSVAPAARPCPKLSFRSQSFIPTSTSHTYPLHKKKPQKQPKTKTKKEIPRPPRKGCCFSSAKAHAADQRSGLLARSVPLHQQAARDRHLQVQTPRKSPTEPTRSLAPHMH